MPIELLGVDSDNDKVFVNETPLAYCQEHAITFTRCRPYHKNDQVHVEQKNGAGVRAFIGYDRFDTPQAAEALNAFYEVLCPYVNFFQSSLRFKDKHRRGAKVTEHYHPAATLYQRLLDADALAPEKQGELEELYESLDPIGLKDSLYRRLGALWKLAA